VLRHATCPVTVVSATRAAREVDLDRPRASAETAWPAGVAARA